MTVTINNQIYKIGDIRSIGKLVKSVSTVKSEFTPYISENEIGFGVRLNGYSVASKFEDTTEPTYKFLYFELNFFKGDSIKVEISYPDWTRRNVSQYLYSVNEGLPIQEVVDTFFKQDWEEYIKLINQYNDEIKKKHDLLVAYWSTGNLYVGTEFNFNYK